MPTQLPGVTIITASLPVAAVTPRALPEAPLPQPWAAATSDLAIPSLVGALASVPEPRDDQGLRHPLSAMPLSTLYAMLCGKQHPAAIFEWVHAHYQAWLRDFAGFTEPDRPCRTTFYLLLGRLDWRALEQALSGWMQALAATAGVNFALEALALDGKEVRGVRRRRDRVLHLVSAFTHESGLTLALRAYPEGQEQEAVQALLRELTLTGRVITADALHTQRPTAALIRERGGDYVLTAKGNQPTLVAEIQACLAPHRAAGQDRDLTSTYDRAHGRQERRTLVAVSLKEGDVDWPGAAQVFCLTRTVTGRPGKTRTLEVVWGITSLAREQADAARLLRLNRGHWCIENRGHWVRDVSFREDAGLVSAGRTAEALAAIRTSVMSVLRIHGVENLASQLRQNADRPREAARFLGLT